MTTVVYMEDGHSVSLTTEIGSGGEGVIYASLSEPLQCAKIYTKPVLPETYTKLSLMVSNPPPDPTYKLRMHRSICWPTALLYKSPSKNALAGFFMPKLDLERFRKALLFIDPQDRTARFGGGFTWKHLVTAATNIASAVAAIHEQGYCIGDLNESNILIGPNALISLIDCDSFQVPDAAAGKTYRSPVGKGEYLAPELSGKHLPDVDRTIASDSFALAVLLFQLLMEGTHPYQAKGRLVENAPSTEAKILLGHFPYGMRHKEIAPPDHAPPFEMLHPEMRKLFDRCFTRGHGSPDQRPTAREWYSLLRNLDSTFRECGTNPNHLYFDQLRSCPWCEIEPRRGRDPFPSPVGQQVAMDNSANLLDSLEKRLEYLHPYVVMAFADGILTSEEESQLSAFGKKLQIPPKEIEKLIQTEAAEVHGKRGKVPGSPEITLSRTSFEFNNIRQGTPLSGRYTITNTGGGTLSGTTKANRPWVALPQGAIDRAHHIQEHTFYLDTSKLTMGTRNRATIEIASNAGTVRIDVSVAVEMERAALSRWRKQVFWAGLLAIGVIGLLLYAMAPSTWTRDAMAKVAMTVRRAIPPPPPPPENKVMIIAPVDGWSVALVLPPDFIQKRLRITWEGNIVAQDDEGDVYKVRVGAGLVGREAKGRSRWLRFRSTTGYPVTMYATSPFPASECPLITFKPGEPERGAKRMPRGASLARPPSVPQPPSRGVVEAIAPILESAEKKLKVGDYDGALADAERAAKLSPRDESARALLERVRKIRSILRK